MKSLVIALLLSTCPLIQAQKGCGLSGNIVICNGHIATSSELNAIIQSPQPYIDAGIYAPRAGIRRDSRGRIYRSKEAKDQFKRDNPCPANGKPYGRCPGYVIDHIQPLACGGADAPATMQWQSIEDGKAKDKIERRNCGGQ